MRGKLARWERRRGSVFLLAMVALICLLILGVSLLEISVNGLVRSSRSMREAEAMALAESGVEMALNRLYYNEIDVTPASGTYAGTFSLPEGSIAYDVLWPVSGIANTYRITATATSWRHRTETVRVIARMLETTPLAFDGAIFSDSNMRFNGGGTILPDASGQGGDMYANGNIEFRGGAFVMDPNASIYTTGTITGPTPPDVDLLTNIAPIPMPVLDIAYYRQMALEDQAETGVQHVFNSTGRNWMLPSQLNLTGVIFIEGDVRIGGNYTGTAAIVASGRIIIDGTADSTSPGTTSVAVMSPIGITIMGGAKVYGLVYAHGVRLDATANVGGNVYIEGVLCADQVTTGTGSITVKYHNVWDLDYPGKGLAQFAQISWETLNL